jgi:hypothetical protein
MPIALNSNAAWGDVNFCVNAKVVVENGSVSVPPSVQQITKEFGAW